MGGVRGSHVRGCQGMGGEPGGAHRDFVVVFSLFLSLLFLGRY